jgi:hypothetical protein
MPIIYNLAVLMSIAKEEALRYIFPSELVEYFDIVSIQELGNVKAKEDYYEVIFEEKAVIPERVNASEYESKGFFSKIVQDFPLRGRAVFLEIKRRRWRHKQTGAEISRDFSFLAEGSKFTKELADFLKEGS